MSTTLPAGAAARPAGPELPRTGAPAANALAAPPVAGPEIVAAVDRALAAQAGRPGALLPVLHDVHHALGHVPAEAVPLIARGLNLSRADVHGVLTFYRDLRTEPGGRVSVQVCRGEACQAVGARELVTGVSAALGVELGGTTPDGDLTLDEVFCLGNCSLGPSALIAGRCHGRLSGADGVQRVVSLAREAVSEVAGASAPESVATSAAAAAAVNR